MKVLLKPGAWKGRLREAIDQIRNRRLKLGFGCYTGTGRELKARVTNNILVNSGVSNENTVKNYFDIALLNVVADLNGRYRHIFIP